MRIWDAKTYYLTREGEFAYGHFISLQDAVVSFQSIINGKCTEGWEIVCKKSLNSDICKVAEYDAVVLAKIVGNGDMSVLTYQIKDSDCHFEVED